MIAKRKRWIAVILLAALALLAWFIFFPNNKAKAKAERQRRSLAAQGFKTDLAQFDLRERPDTLARSEKVLAAGQQLQDFLPFRSQGFFRPVGSNAAILMSADDALKTEISTNEWSRLRQNLESHQAVLDEVCAALISGPLRFQLDRDSSGGLVMQYLNPLRAISGALAARTLLELHDGHKADAWTNLLALTRLVTAWNTEPLEFAHFMKFNFAVSAARATWEAQRLHALDRSELAALSHEWAATKIFDGLPATTELNCALTLQMCEAQRDQPANASVSVRQAVGDFFDSPQRGWSEATSSWRQSRYKNFGLYEDELVAMNFYAARQRKLEEALHKHTWAEIRAIPDITNNLVLQGVGPITFGRGGNGRGSGQGFSLRQRSLATRAAECEARRRLVCAALALESFYLDRHKYPASLEELPREAVIPLDFMDGQPLRYRRINEQDFLLYSIGPDCVDDGGIALWDTNLNGFAGRGFFRAEEPDILWPRVASALEALAQANSPGPERRRSR